MTSESSDSHDGYFCHVLRHATYVHVSWPTSFTCHDQRHLRHVNLMLSFSCQTFKHTSYRVWKRIRMYQQCSAIVKHYIKCLLFRLFASGTNSCSQPKSSMINRLINDPLLKTWQTVNQTSSQIIGISHSPYNGFQITPKSILQHETSINFMKFIYILY